MKHVFYAVDCGIHTADGEMLVKFGISSEEGLANRIDSFLTLSTKPPVVLGILTFMTRKQAHHFEQETLKRFQFDAPKQRPNSELRVASREVMRFIETELYPCDIDYHRHGRTQPEPHCVATAAAALTPASTLEEIRAAYQCSAQYARTIRKEKWGF